MKILLHGINYGPEVAGIGKYTGELGAWLAARGHEVRVVTAPPYYPQWRVGEGYSARSYRCEWVDGAVVWRCPLWVPARPSGAKRMLHLASFAASSLPVVLWQAARWRPDVIFTVAPSLMCAPHMFLAARVGGSRTWLHVQDFELDAALDLLPGLGALGGKRLRRALYGIERSLFRGADVVSTITGAMARRVVEKGVSAPDVRVFPNWSDVERVRPMPPDQELRREFGAAPDDVLVLYAGNMGEKQGLEVVLDAAESLRSRLEIKFAMVGAGAARERLEAEAARRDLRNVQFFPLRPVEELPSLLAAGDVHLVVQRREAADLVMPSKLTNILAAGRPGVATADPGTELYRILTEHGCGVVTPPESAEELAGAVERLADDAPERARLGRNARRYAEVCLDRERILSEFERQLHELVIPSLPDHPSVPPPVG